MGTVTDSVAKAVAEGLLPRRVLVACSGGADSVALAVAAARHGSLDVALGHVDHGLRAESAREADEVRALARALGVPCFVERIKGLKTSGPGLEAAARTARYSALARLAAQAGSAAVATAHTRRDQAETVLLRLIRGAGPGALAGVRRKRRLAEGTALVRPLLDVSREETEAFCREQGFSYVTDPHNADPARTRARVRALWPLLRELNPRLDEALAGAARAFADEDELMTELAQALGDLRTAHPALVRRALLLKAAQAGVAPERLHLDELRKLLRKGRGSLDVPGGRAVVRDGHVRFEKPQSEERPGELAIARPGRYLFGTREFTLGAEDGLSVDLARAPLPWTLRPHRPGDRFRPAGGRTRKVSDLWIDARVPREIRPRLAILEDAEGRLFWVEGVRGGPPMAGAMSHIAVFGIRPELKDVAGRLIPSRRPESHSATMDRRSVKEPR